MKSIRDSRGLQYMWLVLLLGSGLFYTLSQCSFWLYGDSANFIIDANKLRRGYFADNQRANELVREGKPSVHNRLITEGGFPFLLWFSRTINPNLPFILNAFIAPLFFAAMGWLLFLTDRQRGPPLAFVLFIILFMVQSMMRFQLQRYCFPYRDMSAHTLALLSLCFALCARHGEKKAGWLACSGFSLGLGMWFRVPVFLFIPAAAVLLLYVVKDTNSGRSRIWFISAMALGGVLGLTPLFAQNLFEGKAFYQSGQMEIMVSSESLSAKNPGSATVSLANASFNAWPQLRLALQMTPIWVWGLITIGLIHSAFRQRIRLLVLITVALTFYLFYACYIKPVDRYIWMVNFVLLPFGVTWIADRLAPIREKLFPIATLLASAILIGFGITSGNFNDIRRMPRDTKHFTQWLNNQIKEPTVVVTPSHALQAWTANYGDPHVQLLRRWSLHARDDDRKIYPLPFPFKGNPHAMMALTFGGEDEQRLPSVWRDDMLNEYQLDLAGERRLLSYSPFSWLELERITPRSTVAHTAAQFQTDTPQLFIAAKLYEGAAQEVSLSSGSTDLGRHQLAGGPNLLTMPNSREKTFTLKADAPMPAIDFMKVGRIPVLRHDFLGYGNMPSVSNYVRNINFFIYQYDDWSRDWGHNEHFPTIPVVRAFDKSAFRVPPQPPKLSVRIFLTARIPTDRIPPAAPLADLAHGMYSYGESSLQPTTWRIGPPYAFHRHTHTDLIHDVFIEHNLGSDTFLTLRCPDLPDGYDLILLRTEYQIRGDEYQPVHSHGTQVLLPRGGQKWASGIPHYFPRFDELEKLEAVDHFD